MLLYYITDRTQFPGPEAARRQRLLAKIAEAARCGVDYMQLREKDLPDRELESLAREAVRVIREARPPETGNSKPETCLLINSRTDIALAVGADGVHLRSDDICVSDARAIWASSCGTTAPGCPPVIGVSCHALEEVREAEAHGANFAVFGPVYEKLGNHAQRGVGLDALRAAVAGRHMPVLALGGVTLENARACLDAGAAGIAAIRLFQENDICRVAEALHKLGEAPDS